MAESIRIPVLVIANGCGAVVVLLLVRCMHCLGALDAWAFWGAWTPGDTTQPASVQ